MTRKPMPAEGAASAAAWLRLRGLSVQPVPELAQERLGELVEEMEREAGPVTPEACERVLAHWFADE